MQLSPDHSDIDRAIAALEIGIGKIIKNVIQPDRKSALLAEIGRLEIRLANARARHQRTEPISREFCEKTTLKIQFELAGVV